MRSLRTQLLVSHLALVLLMAAVTSSAIWSFVTIGSTLGKGVQGNAVAARGAEIVDGALIEQRTALWLLLAGEPAQAQITYHGSWERFEEGIQAAEESGEDGPVPGYAEHIAEQATSYRNLADRVITSAQLDDHDDSRTTITHVLEPQIAMLRASAAEMLAAAQEARMTDSREARQNASAAIRRSIWVTLIAFGLAFLLGMRLVKTAIAPLAGLAARAEGIARGDLAPRKSKLRHDEIGALNDSIEQMATRIADSRKQNLRKMYRAQQMSDAALEHLYDPVVVLDQKARIVHLNQAGDRLLGAIPEGSKVPVQQHISDRRLARALMQATESQSVSASEDEQSLIAIQGKDGPKTYRFRATPMQDEEGQLIGSVAVLEDVTHLWQLDKLKNEFIGVASHELRTPVSSLILSAQLLKDRAAGPLTEGQEQIVDMQIQDLERLEKLMRDLLDVTKLEAGSSAPRLERLTATELMKPPVEGLKSQAANRGISLTMERAPSDLEVEADRGQIGRVLTNLISNAIRHTKSGGCVNVSALAVDNEVTFQVEDSGEGIPREYLSRIFERFVQVPGATQGGAGLGLSIAHNIVHAHGGRMSVESRVGIGSVFSFTLPRAKTRGGVNVA